MRAKKQPMSRAEFLAKVERLLGEFDSDSFMHGFNSGVDLVCNLLEEWSRSAFQKFELHGELYLLMQKKLKQVRKTRRN